MTGTNDAPVATFTTAQSVAEDDASISGSVTSTDVDVETATYSLVGSAIAGLTFNADGSWTFNPSDAAYQGLDVTESLDVVVTYKANDGTVDSANQSFTITVTGTNDAPVATFDADQAATEGDVEISGSVTSTDVDVEAATYALTNGPVAGLTFNADGSWTFDPTDAAYEGLDATESLDVLVKYTANDGTVDSAEQTFTITITGTNDAVTVTSVVAAVNTITDTDAADTYTDVSGDVSISDADTSDTHTYKIVDSANSTEVVSLQGTYGTLSVDANGHYTYAVDAAAVNALQGNSSEVFTFVVNDGNGSTDTATVTFNIIGTNDTFTSQNDIISATEDTVSTGNVLTNDDTSNREVETLKVTEFSIGGGTAVSVPDDAVGATKFILKVGNTFSLADAASGTASQNVGSVTMKADGSFSFTPASNWNGVIGDITYTAVEALDPTHSSTAVLRITVAAVNDTVVANNDSGSGLQNTALRGNVLTNDTDIEVSRAETGAGLRVDSFTFDGVTKTAGQTATTTKGSFTISAIGAYTFTPATGYYNSAATPLTATYVVRDLTSSTDVSKTTATGTLSMVINNAPVTDTGTDSGGEDTDLTGTLTDFVTDPNVGQSLTFSNFKVDGIYEQDGITLTSFAAGDDIVIDGKGTLVVQADGSYAFTPVLNFNGVLPSLQYTVSDGTVSVSDVLNLTVTAVNDAPVLADTTDVGTEDVALSGNVLHDATDIEGDDITVATFTVAGDDTTYNAGETAQIAGKGSLIVNADGSYTFTPTANWNGTLNTVTIIGTDGTDVSEQSVTLQVSLTAVNDAPVASDDTNSGAEDADAPVSGSVLDNDSDIEGSALLVDSFTVNGLTTNLSANTPSATVSVGANGSIGSLTFNRDGTYEFTPTLNWNGSVPTISYVVSDGELTSTASLSITITSVNDTPTATVDVYETTRGTVKQGSLFDNDSDVEDGTNLTIQSYSVSGQTGPFTVGTTYTMTDGRGTLLVRANGTFVFTPAQGYLGGVGADGLTTISYTAVDSQGADVSSTATIRTNDRPTAEAITLSFNEDGTAAGNLISGTQLINGSPVMATNDNNGDDLSVVTFTIDGVTKDAGETITVADVGQITVSSTGEVTVALVEHFNSSNGSFPQISYTFTDGLLTQTNSVNFTVEQVNDAPTITAEDTYAVTEDVTKAISDISIGDVDSEETDGAQLTVTLTVNSGTLTLSTTTGLTFTTGMEAGNAIVQFTGSKADINTALATLSYVPLSDNNVDDTLLIEVDDNGNSGTATGSLATASRTVDLVYTAANDVTNASVDDESGEESALISGNLLSNDTDVDNHLRLNASPTTTVVEKFYYLNAAGIEQEATTFGSAFAVYAEGQNGQTGTFVKAGDISINPTTGAYEFTGTEHWNGELVLSYVSGDGNTSSGRTTLTITVTGTSDDTTGVDDTDTVDEAGVVSGNVLTNDVDADRVAANNATPSTLSVTKFSYVSDSSGTVLEYTAGGAPVTVYARQNSGSAYVVAGTLSMGTAGFYSFTGSADYNGPVEVTYTVLDSTANSTETTAKLTLTVTQVDDVPTTTDKSGALDEEGTLSVGLFTGNLLAGSVDPDTDASLNVLASTTVVTGLIHKNAAGTTVTTNDLSAAIEVYKVAGVLAGTITINSATGEYTFVGATDFNGTLDLQFTVGDGVSSSEPADLTLTVNEVNDSTVAVNDTISASEAGTLLQMRDVQDFNTGDLGGWSNRYWDAVNLVWVTAPANDVSMTGSHFANTATQGTYAVGNGYRYISFRGDSRDNSTSVLWIRSTSFVLGSDGDLSLSMKGGAGGSDTAPTSELEVATSANSTGWAGVVLRDANTGAFLITKRASGGADNFSTLTFTQSELASFVGRTITVDVIDSYAGSWGWISFDNLSYPKQVVASYSGNLLSNDSDVDTTVDLNAAPRTMVVQAVIYRDADGVERTNNADGNAFDVYRAGYNSAGGWTKVGTMTVASNGAYTFDPYADFNGSVSLTYAVSDNRGSNSFASIDINVAQVNDAIVVTADTATVSEGSVGANESVSGNVLTDAQTGDSDIDTAASYNGAQQSLRLTQFQVDGGAYGIDDVVGATRSVTLTGGTLVMGRDGSYTFTTTGNWNGTVPLVTYHVTDDNGSTTTSTLALTVTAVNDDFTAQTGSVTIVEDESAGTTGTILTNSDSANVDNVLNGSSETLTITSASVGATNLTLDEDTILAGKGVLHLNSDGTYVFTQTEHWNGTFVIDFTATDADGAHSSSSTFTVTVTPVNDTFVVTDRDRTIDEDAAQIIGSLLNVANGANVDNVTDGSSETLTIISATANGQSITTLAEAQDLAGGIGRLQVNPDGFYAFTPGTNWNGDLVITFTTTDQGDHTVTSTFTITVESVNDATDMANDTATGGQNTVLRGNVKTNDNDIDSNSFSITEYSINGDDWTTAGTDLVIDGKGTINIGTTGVWSFNPVTGFAGAVNDITYRVIDTADSIHGDPITSSATLKIVINDAPLAVNDSVTVTEYNSTQAAAFADGSPTNVLVNDTDVNAGATRTVTTFTVSGVYANGVSGALQIFNAGDVATVSGKGSVTIASNGDITVSPTQYYRGDFPVLTYTAKDAQANADGSFFTTTGSLAITVVNANDAPEATNDAKTGTEFGVVRGNVLSNDIDRDDDTLTIASFQVTGDNTVYTAGQTATISGKGTISIAANGSYLFVGEQDYNGAIPTVTYTVSDGQLTDTGDLNLTLTAVNSAPIAVNDSGSGSEDTALTGNVLTNDTDVDNVLGDFSVVNFKVTGDSTTYSAGQTATISGKGTLVINTDGSYTFTPSLNWNGTVPTVVYTMQDANLTSQATLSLSVTAVNDTPVGTVDTNTGSEDSNIVGNILTNDTDVEKDALSVTQFTVNGDLTTYTAGQTATIASKGTIQVNADGSYVFTPVANFNGSVPVITYTLSDGALTSTSTLTLSVTAVNDAPVGTNDTGSANEDASATGNVLTNDTDLDNVLADFSVTQFTVDGQTKSAGQTATIANKGALTINANGTYTFTPVSNWNGSVPVATYTFSDGALTHTAQLAITITAVNDTPVGTVDTASGAEDSNIVGNVLTNDTDVENNALSVTQFLVAGDVTAYTAGQTATIASKGTIQVNADGSYVFSPVANFNGSVPVITYTLSDGALTSTSTLSLSVTAVNDAPVAVSDSATAAEDVASVTGNVLTNDTDTEGTALTVSAFTVNGVAGTVGTAFTITNVGSFTLTSTGAYTFVPTANWNGVVPTIAYTATDGTLTSTSTLALTITAVNDTPVGTADTSTVAEDTNLSGNVLTNDTDIEKTVLTVTAFTIAGEAGPFTVGTNYTIAGKGTLNLASTGAWTFTPVANWNGSVPVITYTLSDGSATSTSTLTLTVTAVNDAPVAVADSATAAEDVASVTGNVLTNDTDTEGTTLTVSGFTVNGVAGTVGTAFTITNVGSFTLTSTGAYTFVPTANWNGVVPTIAYTATDGTLTSTSTLALTITAVNDTPVGTADTSTVAEDTNLSGNVLTNDTDIEKTVLTVTAFTIAGEAGPFTVGTNYTIAGKGTLNLASTGAWTFTPVANWNGSVPVVTYTLSDGVATTTSTLTLTVTAVNDAPVAVSDSATAAEDVASVTGNVLTNDSDVDSSLTVSAFTVNGVAGTLGSAFAIANVGSFTLASTGAYTFVPTANWNGVVPTIAYTATDGTLTSTSTLALTITAVNDTPVGIADISSGVEDTNLSGNVLGNDTDVEKTVLTVTAFSIAGETGPFTVGSNFTLAGKGTFNLAATGAYTFTPVAHFNGSVPVVTYTLSDGVATTTSTLTLSLSAVNDAPVAVSDSATGAEDATFVTGNVLTNDTDVDSSLTVASFTVNGVAGTLGSAFAIANVGNFTLNSNGTYAFTPLANWNGVVPTIAYTATDGTLTSTSTLALTITAVNDTPVGVADTAAIAEDVNLAGNVLANDTDVEKTILAVTRFLVAGDATVYTAGQTATIATKGTIRVNADGSYLFTPVANYNGAVPVVTYTLTDGAITSTSTLTLTVNAVNDAPVAADDTVTVAEDNAATGNVLTNDSDVDAGTNLAVTQFTVFGDATVYAAGQTATLAGRGTLTIDSTGAYTFTPVAHWNGSVPLATYTVTDGTATATAKLAVVLTAVNDTPVGTADTGTGAEDANLTGNVLSNDTDVEATNLSVTAFSIAGQSAPFTLGSAYAIANVGSFTLTSTGAYVFTPVAHFNGAVPVVSYTLSDGSLTSTSSLTLTITAVNDAPVALPDALTGAEDDAALTGNVLTNDSDVDSAFTVASFTVNGQTKTAGQTATLAGIGALTINADGSYSFTPVAHWNGTVPTVAYTITDGSLTSTSALTLTVTAVNDAPTLVADTLTGSEDATLAGNALSNDSDIDFNPLSITQFTVDGQTKSAGQIATLAGKGSFTISASGAYTFTPVANWNGSVPVITYTATDGVATATSTITLTMTAVNDAPRGIDDTSTATEDVVRTGNVLTNDTDVDGTTPTVTSFLILGDATTYAAGTTAVIAGKGSIVINVDGSWTFTPEANANGTVPTITYRITDGTLTSNAKLSLSINALNDAPVGLADAATGTEDANLTGNLLANDTDVDADTLAVTKFTIGGTDYTAGTTATIAGQGTLRVNANGTYVFTPNTNFNGSVSGVTYTLTDGSLTTTSSLTLAVTAVNDAPVGSNDTGSANEDASATGNVLTNDADVDNVLADFAVTQFTVDGQTVTAGQTATIAGKGDLTINVDGSYTFTPVSNWNGSVPVATYTFTDGALTHTAQLGLSITAVNDTPVGVADANTGVEDTNLAGNVLSNDTDVENANLAVTQFTIGGTDYTAGTTATIAGQGTLRVNANGTYVFTPNTNFNGSVSGVTYTLTDGSLTTTSSLTLAVTAVNDAPVGSNDTGSANEDASATGNVLTNDADVDNVLADFAVTQFTVDGQTVTAGQTATIAGKGDLTINVDGSYTFTPVSNWNGSVPVATYTFTDGALTHTAQLALTITAVNDTPVATADTGSAAEDTALLGNVLSNDTDVENANLAVTQFTVAGTNYAAGTTALVAGQGTLRVNANGSYVFTPSANFNGAVSGLSYTVTDGSLTTTSTLALTVTAVNDAPLGADDTASANEEGVATGNVLTNDTDVENDALTVTQFTVAGDASIYAAGAIATLPGKGTLVINANGTFTFTPVSNWNGTVPLATYTLSDGAITTTAKLGVTIAAVNDAPVGSADANTGAEDTNIAGNVLTNDTDVENNTLAVTQFTVAGDAATYAAGTTASLAAGTITVNANGSYVFTPSAHFNGNVPVLTYTVTDGSLTTTSTLALTVTAVNDAPVGTNDAQVGSEDVAITGNLVGNDSDLDADSLTVTQFSIAGQTRSAGQTAVLNGIGALTVNADGSYSFVPDANYYGAVPVATITITDGVATANQLLTISLAAVNDAPVAGNDSKSGTEDTNLSGNVLPNDFDLDADVLTVSKFTINGTEYNAGTTASLVGQGLFVLNSNGSYFFTPSANFNGNLPAISYTITDGNLTSTSTLALNLSAVNDAPVGTNDTVAGTEDETITGNLVGNDSDLDADSLTVTGFTIAGQTKTAGQTAVLAGIGSLTINANGSYSFTPAANYVGAVPVATVTITDGVATANQLLTISLAAVNDTPTPANDSKSGAEDTNLTGSVLGNDSDIDGDRLTVSQFTINGTDYAAGSVATLATGSFTLGADGKYVFTPNTSWNGIVPAITVTVTDGNLSATSTLNLTVTGVNDAPIAVTDTGSSLEDTVATGNVLTNDTDVDGDMLSVTNFTVNGVTKLAGQTTVIAGVGSLTVNANGSYSFTPATNWNGNVPQVTYTATDGALVSTGKLLLAVTAVNDGPTALNDAKTGAEDKPLQGNVLTNDTDVEFDTLTVTEFTVAGDATVYTAGQTVTIAGKGELTVNADGKYVFSPDSGWFGSVPTIAITVTDGALTTSSTLALTVTGVNDAPVAFADTFAIENNVAITGNLLANDSDIDGDILTLNRFIVSGAARIYAAGQTASIAGKGSLTINSNGTFTFVPANGWSGNVPTVMYAVTDGQYTSFAKFNLAVIGYNAAPVANNDTASTAEDVVKTGNVLTNDTDPENNPLEVDSFNVDGTDYAADTTATITGIGTIRITTAGAYTFTPATNWNGTVPAVSVTITDGNKFSTSTLALTVTAVNDAPVVLNDTASVAEDNAVTGNVLTNDSDIEGSALSVTQFTVTGLTGTFAAGGTATIAGKGALTVNADGSYTFTPVADWNGVAPVATVTVSDGTATSTATLTVTVTAVNDAPIGVADVSTVFANLTRTGNVLTNDSDVDGNTLSIVNVTVAGDATVYTPGQTITVAGKGALTVAANGAYSFVPVAAYLGSVPTFSYTLTDGTVTATSSLTLNVIPLGAVNDVVTGTEDVVLTGNVRANDAFANATAAISQFTVAGVAGTFTAGQTATITGKGTLTIAANGAYTFTPTAQFNGALPDVTYTFVDGTTLTSTAKLQITLTAVNDGPNAVANTATVLEDNVATGNVLTNDSDVEGSTLTVTVFTVAGDATVHTAGESVVLDGKGTLTLAANGAYSFTPVAHWNGIVPVVTYTVTDGELTSTSTLAITVTAVNDAATLGNDSATVLEDNAATGNVLTNDSDIEGALTVTSFAVSGVAGSFTAGSTATLAGKGTLTIAANGAWTFTPVANWNGAVPTVTVSINDGGTTVTSTLAISITSVNDGPTAVANTATMLEDGATLAGNVLTNDSDVEGSALTLTEYTIDGQTKAAGQSVTLAGKGTLTVAANGAWTFAAVANFSGAVPTLTYTVTDGAATSTSTLSISVTAVNDNPIAVADSFSFSRNVTGTGNVLSNDVDVDGDTLTVSSIAVAGSTVTGLTCNIAGKGVLTFNPNGTFTFVPVAGWFGTLPAIYYKLSDGKVTTIATLTIKVL